MRLVSKLPMGEQKRSLVKVIPMRFSFFVMLKKITRNKDSFIFFRNLCEIRVTPNVNTDSVFKIVCIANF